MPKWLRHILRLFQIVCEENAYCETCPFYQFHIKCTVHNDAIPVQWDLDQITNASPRRVSKPDPQADIN